MICGTEDDPLGKKFPISCIRYGDTVQLVCEKSSVINDKYKELDRDIVVVQPMNVRYNWNEDDDFRVESLAFDIENDVIDFNGIPQLLGYSTHERTLRNWVEDPEAGNGKPYYDHWSDRYMTLDTNPITGNPRITLRYDEDSGHNFSNVYLKWKLPKGMKVMDIIDRLGGYLFGSTASNIDVKCNNDSVICSSLTCCGKILNCALEKRLLIEVKLSYRKIAVYLIII